MANSSSPTKQQNKVLKEHDRGKLHNSLFFKALLVITFLVLIPLFPSQTPELVNQTYVPRVWEVLHLIVFGLAVSYGLFSRRNDGTEKENNYNHAKFDNAHSYMSKLFQVSSVFDEESENESGGESKLQTWRNRYQRDEPMLLVAKDQSLAQEQGSGVRQKPLLLPVRSLRSRATDGNPVSESGLTSVSSNSRKKTINGEVKGSNHVESNESSEESVVLPSPIPWGSGPERLAPKRIKDDINSPGTKSSASSSPRFPASPSFPASSKRFSPSPSLSSETLGKSTEGFFGKKTFFEAPPPPPPPPPPMSHKASSTRPAPRFNDSEVSPRKHVRRSCRSVQLEGSRPRSPRPDRPMGPQDPMLGPKRFEESSIRSYGLDPDPQESNVKVGREPAVGYFPRKATLMGLPKEENEGHVSERVAVETYHESCSDDDEEVDNTGASSLASRMLGIEEHAEREEEAPGSGNGSGDDEGPDVDKKAAEFIAKFREQIRLQRIEDIKRSSAQIRRKINNSR